MATELEKKFFRIFNPEDPSPGDLDSIYVDLKGVRGDAQAGSSLSVIEKNIRLASPDAPICRLLAGHKGSGKTIELMRLKERLEKSGNFFVVHWLAKDDVNVDRVDFPDLVLGLVAALSRDLEKRHQIKLKATGLAGILRGMHNAVRATEVSEVVFGHDLAKVTAQIKGSPDLLKRAQQYLDNEAGSLLSEANNLIKAAREGLRQIGRGVDIVILVDDLDKGGEAEHSDSRRSLRERLFVDRFAQLTGFACHVVYSIPLDLAFGPCAGTLQSRYGDIPLLPMVEVRHRPPNHEPNQAGIERLKELVYKRITGLGVTRPEEIISDGVLTELVVKSGGEPRQLLHFMRESSLDGLPITDAAAESAFIRASRTMTRILSDDDRRILREICQDGRRPSEPQHAERFRTLLFNRLVLQYCNADEWFAPSPLLGEVDKL